MGCCLGHGHSPHAQKRKRPWHKTTCCGINMACCAKLTCQGEDVGSRFLAGEEAEVQIASGLYKGTWVKCVITGFVPHDSFSIRVLPTTDFNHAGGTSGKEFPKIAAKHLRKVAETPRFAVHELAEVVVLNGQHKNKWLACQVTGLGSLPDQYHIHVLRIDDHDAGAGNSRKDLQNISVQHLSKVQQSSKFWVGEVAEVTIRHGVHEGNWVLCQVISHGYPCDCWNIHVLPTEDFDGAAGNSNKTLENIAVSDLRKAFKQVTYSLGEEAEVRVLSGPHKDKWFRCKVCGPGIEPEKYNIQVLSTTANDNAAGNAGKVLMNIDTDHLRKVELVSRGSFFELRSTRTHRDAVGQSLLKAVETHKLDEDAAKQKDKALVTSDIDFLEDSLLKGGFRAAKDFGLPWERKLGKRGHVMWVDDDTGMAWLSHGIGLVPKCAMELLAPQEDGMPSRNVSKESMDLEINFDKEKTIKRFLARKGMVFDREDSDASLDSDSKLPAASNTSSAFPDWRAIGSHIGHLFLRKQKKKPHHELVCADKTPHKKEEDQTPKSQSAPTILHEQSFEEGTAACVTKNKELLESLVKRSGLPWPKMIRGKPWVDFLGAVGVVMQEPVGDVILIKVNHELTIVPVAALEVPEIFAETG